MLYAPDPALEIEDKFTVDGQEYIASRINWLFTLQKEGRPKCSATIGARKVIAGGTDNGTGKF